MAHGTASDGPRREPTRPPVANGLHAFAHAVKPHGTRRNRISSAESAARAGRVHNSPGENREFFQNCPPPDGPRTPPPLARPMPPAASEHARGNGELAPGGAPCHARSPDTGVPPATPTRPAPPPNRRRYSTVPEHDRGRTTARTPSTDRSAHGRPRLRGRARPGLASAENRNHAGPQTQGASTPDGQVPAAEPLLRTGTA